MKKTIYKYSLDSKKVFILFLVLFSLVGFLVSALTINHSSIWHDESYTMMITEGSPSEIVSRTKMDVHPPLYYLALKGWFQIFPQNITSARFFSAVTMFTALIILIIFIAKKYSYRIGFYALPSLIASPLVFRFSQEARMYGLIALISVILTTIFLSSKRSLKYQIVYGLLAAALLYTHYLSCTILASHFILSIYEKNKQDTKWLFKSFILSGIIFLPWLPTLKNQMGDVNNGFWIGPIATDSYLNNFSNLILGRTSWQTTGWLAILLFSLAVSLFYLSKLFRNSRSSKDIKKDYIQKSFLLVIFSIIILTILSIPPFTSVYYNRYLLSSFIFIYPAIFILIGQVLSKVRSKKAILASVLIFGSMIFGSIRVLYHGVNTEWNKNTFTMKSAFRYANQPSNNNQDYFISTTLWTYFDLRYYYLDQGLDINKLKVLEPTNGFGDTGNHSLLYKRPELSIKNLNQIPKGSIVWLFQESNTQSVPSNWVQLKNYQPSKNSYLKLEQYKVN